MNLTISSSSQAKFGTARLAPDEPRANSFSGGIRLSSSRRGCFAAAVIVLAMLSSEVSAHGDDHPPVLRSGSSQFTFFKSPKPVPSMSLLAEHRSPSDLEMFRGRLLLMNFWATWCAPCVEELPALGRLQKLLGNEMFAIVALSIDEADIDRPAAFVRRLGVTGLNVYQDMTGRATEAFPLYGLPITYLIAGDGLMVGYIVGAVRWDSAEAVAFLQHYMDGGDPGATVD